MSLLRITAPPEHSHLKHRYIAQCDSCGRTDTRSLKTRDMAHKAALGHGWTYDPDLGHTCFREHDAATTIEETL